MPGANWARSSSSGPARAGKAKVRHVEGDLDGLEEWAPTRTVMCPWGERQAFLRVEPRWHALQEAAARDYDPIVEEAISAVFEATGDETGFARVWTVDPERAKRLWRRASLDGAPDRQSLAYTDRQGQLNLPFETALQLAQAFAATEPEPNSLWKLWLTDPVGRPGLIQVRYVDAS